MPQKQAYDWDGYHHNPKTKGWGVPTSRTTPSGKLIDPGLFLATLKTERPDEPSLNRKNIGQVVDPPPCADPHQDYP